MQCCQAGGHQAVHLFRERLCEIARTQAGFYMPDGYVLVEGRQCTGECGGGIPLHQQHVRLLGFNYGFEGDQDARGELGERLAGLIKLRS